MGKIKTVELDNQNNQILKYLVIIVDLVVLNLFAWVYSTWNGGDGVLNAYSQNSAYWLALNFAYLVSVSIFPPVLQWRHVTMRAVCVRAFKTVVCLAVCLSVFLLLLRSHGFIYWKEGLQVLLGYYLVLILERLTGRGILKFLRSRQSNIRNVVFVGDTPNLAELYHILENDPSYGYRVTGYFSKEEKKDILPDLVYLGQPEQTTSWIEANKQEQISGIYCSLTSSNSEIIRHIISFCEYHVIMFFSVPNVRNYLQRTMSLAFYGDVPVLYLREMPLARLENKLLKRSFDVCVSGVFLLFFFPWIFLIVAIIMKITMPGPIFFKQKRSGLDGRDFYCYKFRSMKVNKDADTLQATKDDPRKTKFGNLMRHTNIDELPQFWNVLIGNMSLVGPRPHMLKHTEMYSKLIDKYMVRHFAKPGITGWAQVTGCRGETHELWQMEERVKKDIWYIEHWSFLLDLKIMWLTVWNVIANKNDEAY